MNILGIDQSFTCTGFCVLTPEGDILNFGTIKTSIEDGDIYHRARIVVDKLKEIADNNNIKTVCIEGLAFGGVGNATRQLAGLQFLIVDSFRPIICNIIAPTAVKKLALGKTKGKTKKQDLFEVLPINTQNLFLSSGVKKTTGLYDIVDSYFIAKSGLSIEPLHNA
jgi:Holliday junction resolvasome RuvABC endonuclease subunit